MIGQRVLNDNQAFINKVYQDILHRAADAGGLANWEAQLNQGMTRTQVATAIMMSQEGLESQVTDLYTQLLHRQPDQAGLDTFTTFLAQGGTLTDVEAALIGSQEYFTVRGGGTTAGFLQAVYTDALNRRPDAAGAADFTQQLNAGVSRTTVANAILTSPEGREYEVQLMYNRIPPPHSRPCRLQFVCQRYDGRDVRHRGRGGDDRIRRILQPSVTVHLSV